MANASKVTVSVGDVVAIESLKANTWNTNIVSPENEQKIEESLKRFGMFRPIVVRTLPDSSLEILGGQHRWEIAKRLGLKQVPIFNVGEVNDKTAKEIGLVDNGRYGEDDTLALSAMLKELGVDEISTFLPYSQLDLENIITASSISLETLGLDEASDVPEMKDARPAPTHQIMRFKIPVEDVAWITSLIENTMRSKNFTADDSLTNAGNAVVELLKTMK